MLSLPALREASTDLLHCDDRLRVVLGYSRTFAGQLLTRVSGEKEVYVRWAADRLLKEVLITVEREDQLAGPIFYAPVCSHEHQHRVAIGKVMERSQSGLVIGDAVFSGGQPRRAGSEIERDLTLDLTRLGRSESSSGKARKCEKRQHNQFLHFKCLHF